MAHVHLFTLDFLCCPVTQPILWNPRAAPHCQRHLCSECLWNHSSLIPFYRAWICWSICCVVYSPRVSCLWNSSPWEYVFSYHTFPTQTLGFFKSLEWKTFWKSRLTRSPLVHTLVETFQELQQDINVTYLYKSCMDPSQHIIGEFLATCTCICVQDILQHWNLAMLLSRTDTRKLYRWYRGNHITMQSNPCVQTKSCFPIFFFWIHHRY